MFLWTRLVAVPVAGNYEVLLGIDGKVSNTIWYGLGEAPVK